MATLRKEYPWLKRFVIATSFTPFKQLYIVLYKFVIQWIGWQLDKDPLVVAVYLRGGCSRGEIVPGFTDIDLQIIVQDNGDLAKDAHWNMSNLAGFTQGYQRFAHYVPLLDKVIGVYSTSGLEELNMMGFNERYRFIEARASWRLLRGEDYLAKLPEVPNKIWQGAILTRLEGKWGTFYPLFIYKMAIHRNQMMLNSLCYRYCSDMLNRMENLISGRLNLKREGVFERALPHLEGEEKAFVEELGRLNAQGFKGGDGSLVEKTKTFFLARYEAFYRELATHSSSQPLKELRHRIDCTPIECFNSAAEAAHIERLQDWLEEGWKEYCRGIYLVPSVFYGLDDLLLFIEVDPQRLPPAKALFDLYRFNRDQTQGLVRPVRLFLLLPNAAYLFSRDATGRGCYRILPQVNTPDLFQLLKCPEFTLRPSAYQVWAQPCFSVQPANFFWGQKLQLFQRVSAYSVEAEDQLSFLRNFWKYLQMYVIDRSIGDGEILYALTLPAIERGLAAQGADLPVSLRPLAAAYRKAVAGQAIDIAACVPEAQGYLRQIDPQGDQLGAPPPWLVAETSF